MEYAMRIQCTTETGEVGDFIVSEENTLKPISPVFSTVAELFPWMHANGWKLDEYVDHVFHPWRVSHTPVTPA